MTIVVEGVSASVSGANGAKQVLYDVDCRFETGQITLLVGRTGSGKSTLLQTVAGLIETGGGKITFEEERGASGVGIVFQYPEHQLFARTVQSELEYTLRPFRLSKAESEGRIRTALERVKLSASVLERSPFTLSGGEKRKLALASTFVAEPDWLLLDEPSASLDTEGVEWLTAAVREWSARKNGGVIIATHDLDAFLPLANKVILLREGRISAEASPAELARSPQPLFDAGIGLASSMRTALSLGKHGIAVELAADVPPMTPAAMADAIWQASRKRLLATKEPEHEAVAAAAQTRIPYGAESLAYPQSPGSRAAVAAAEPAADGAESVQESARTAEKARSAADQGESGAGMSGAGESLARRLDPRTKWLVSMLVSIGILLQDRWLGIGVSAICTVVLVLLSGAPFRPLWRWTKPFLYFSLFSVGFSGLQLSFGTESSGFEIGFAAETALLTLRQFAKIALVMIVGLLFTFTTTQMQMKRALEITFGALEKWKLPVSAFALGASLLLRFIPIISQEADRLKLAVRARSASFSKGKPLRLRDAPAFVIPLLLSVLQNAEDLSVAMEARGYRIAGQRRTSALKLRLGRLDVKAVALGAALLAVLIAAA
ncbi:ATP-binding cassette domain-containing protein [Paenibacillus contaminans]|uniref:ABC transporter domain-containing protein n=1 Tax=Paenibacillus contaminans TaxID=450362 RepID=A0A329MHS6_9BACL|nr:ATP-binding cassette domain-containing protein [Paenibacillus contaminans]RAV18926.1 hypothetical protein DQG23_22490 [Paenibacillus contaminans]